MKSWTIVGYTYQADIYCDSCMDSIARAAIERLDAEGLHDWELTTEGDLDLWAKLAGVERTDEHSFDSDDFPKVVFADQCEDDERCGQCGGDLP